MKSAMSNERKVVIAELVCRALADLHHPDGSTETQIREYIQNEYKIPDVAIKSNIKTALQTGVAFGLINKKRGKYYQLSKLVDNIQEIAEVRNKPRKLSAKLPVRRIQTTGINKAKRNVGRPKKIYPPQQRNKFNDQIFPLNQNFDEAFDDNNIEDKEEENVSVDTGEKSVSEGSLGQKREEVDGKHSMSTSPSVQKSASADEYTEYDDFNDDSNDADDGE